MGSVKGAVMVGAVPRTLILAALSIGIFLSLFFLWQSAQSYEQLMVAIQEAAEMAERRPAAAKTVALVSLDEVFANVNSGQGENRKMHILGVKLDIELFDETSRPLLDGHVAGVKNAIISTALELDYEWLNTIAGKLFFKETLVARMNEFFHQAIIRDIHFASFYLQ